MKNRELCRNKQRGKIGGVCAGLADYFGIEVWLVRIAVVSAVLLMANPFIIFIYIAAWFILDDKSKLVVSNKSDTVSTESPARNKQNLKGHVNQSQGVETVSVKSKVWQAGLPPRQAFLDIKQRYERIESDLQRLEKYVTSSEFQLSREINRL